jgi:hypothetical protein
MSLLAIDLPERDYAEMQAIAKARGVDVVALSQGVMSNFIQATRIEADFRAAAARGNTTDALAILDRLDKAAS